MTDSFHLENGFDTPVSIFIFNRPELTKSLMAVLKKVRPTKLLVVADGPRDDRPDEKVLCEQARTVALDIDWDCEVRINFAEENLGCKARIVSGLDWVFSLVEKSIILEDDCVPDISFFNFMKFMLERYESNKQIGMISGDNYLFGLATSQESYYFSRYAHIWGWATWRNRWDLYDQSMLQWRGLSHATKMSWLNNISLNGAEKKHWLQSFDSVANNQIDTWDYQWVYTMFNNDLLSVVPRVNLVSNVGFGGDATHTKSVNLSGASNRGRLDFPLTHPPGPVTSNYKLDKIESRILLNRSLLARTIRKSFALLFSRFRRSD